MKNKFDLKNIVSIVPARAGSKGLPSKNIRLLNNVPLYLHAVRQALRVSDKVLLTTDIEQIREQVLPSGCELSIRPAELAQDSTNMDDVIRYLIEHHNLAGKILLLLQPTSPLRLDSDINSALALFSENNYDLVMSISKQDSKVLKFGTVYGHTYYPLRERRFVFLNRQELPPVFAPNGAIYVFFADQFDQTGFPSSRIGAIQMPIERSVDIDSLADFSFVEKMMSDSFF